MRSLWLLPLGFVGVAHAVDQGLGANGVTGLGITPSASVIKGDVHLQHQNRMVGLPGTQADGYNLSGALGLTDFLEFGGRVAYSDTRTNLYFADKPMYRDLSASFKVQANPLLGLENIPLKLAAGSTDYGGAATLFRSTYAVATYAPPSWWQLSAGVARAQNPQGANALHGTFWGGAVQITEAMSARVEHTARGTWVGATLSNTTWLERLGAPQGARAYLSLDHQSSGTPAAGGRPWMGVGVQWPLGARAGDRPSTWRNTWATTAAGSNAGRTPMAPPAPAHNHTSALSTVAPAATPGQAPEVLAQINTTQIATPAGPEHRLVQEKAMQDLAQALVKEGFEGVSVGLLADTTLVVKFTDTTFEHSLLDGAGVALGVLSGVQEGVFRRYRLVQARGGASTLGFTGELDCLKAWLERYPRCDEQRALRPQFRNLDLLLQGVNWQVVDRNPFRYKPRLKLNPVHDYYVATEFSVLDYSIGLQAQPYVHLWDGGSLEVTKVFHMASTTGYAPGGPYNFTRAPYALTTRTVLHHVQKLQDGFSARVSVGQLLKGAYHGGVADLRWDSSSGEWAHGVSAAYWRADEPKFYNETYAEQRLIESSPISGFMRYSPAGTDWALEVQAGKYFYGDKGLSILSSHWFGDTKFTLIFRRSVPPVTFWPGQFTANFLGVEVSFPLTPQRAMSSNNSPSGFQLKGSPRYGLSTGTPVGRPDNYIVDPFGRPIYMLALVDSPVPNYLGSQLMDYDRNGAHYVPYHLERIRNAYETWVIRQPTRPAEKGVVLGYRP